MIKITDDNVTEFYTDKGRMRRNITTEEKWALHLYLFNKEHKGRYTYTNNDFCSKIIQKNKINILCDQHGMFAQRVDAHLSGQGCPDCGQNSRTASRTHSIAGIIKEFVDIHGDYYDYGTVDYVNAHTKVIIVCKEHGDFLQSPTHHKNGVGCPKCHTLHDTIYLYRLTGNTYKVGISSSSIVNKRIRSVAAKHGVCNPEIIWIEKTKDARVIESKVKRLLKGSASTSVEPGVDGYTEMYDLSEDSLLEVIDIIKQRLI